GELLARDDARAGRKSSGKAARNIRADAASRHTATRAIAGAGPGARISAGSIGAGPTGLRVLDGGATTAEQHPEYADHQREDHDRSPRKVRARGRTGDAPERAFIPASETELR